MPTAKIGTKIALDGEKEYKAALTRINAGLKNLNSEMDLTATKFEENSTSMEAMSAKGDVLDRRILSQKEKIETLQAALQNAAQTYGEADKRTIDYQTSLNRAEAELIKLERSQRDNNEAMEKAAKASEEAGESYDRMEAAVGDCDHATKSMGDMVTDLAGKLGVDLPDGARDAIDSVVKFDGKTALMAGTVATAVAAIAKLEKALIDLTRERAEIANGILNISQTIGFSVEATQQWDYVLRSLGSSIEAAQGDLSKLQEKMVEASTGEGEAAELFSQLGINVKDLSTGALRPAEQVFEEIVKSLQLMDDETRRNAISSELLGGTGEALIPIYKDTNQELDDMLQKKADMGVLNQEELEQLQDVNQEMIDYQTQIDTAKDKLALEFAPAMVEFYDKAGEGVADLGEKFAESGIMDTLASILDMLASLIPLLEGAGTAIGVMSSPLQFLSDVIRDVGDAIDWCNKKLSGGKMGEIIKTLMEGGLAVATPGTFGFWLWDKIGGAFDGSPKASTPKTTYEPQMAYYTQPAATTNTYNFNIDANNVDQLNSLVTKSQNEVRWRRMGMGGY